GGRRQARAFGRLRRRQRRRTLVHHRRRSRLAGPAAAGRRAGPGRRERGARPLPRRAPHALKPFRSPVRRTTAGPAKGIMPSTPPAGRDARLDFFRGAALFIIFAAHVHDDWLWSIIPARFGFSDAADLFVFLSGFAASIAFGGTFVR